MKRKATKTYSWRRMSIYKMYFRFQHTHKKLIGLTLVISMELFLGCYYDEIKLLGLIAGIE